MENTLTLKRETFMRSVKRKAARGGRTRFQQRFLPEQHPDGLPVCSANGHVAVFVEVALPAFAERDNPWWTFAELWDTARDAFMVYFSNHHASEKGVRNAMRSVWSKAAEGHYALMEKRAIR
jgi:hypothetical protein